MPVNGESNEVLRLAVRHGAAGLPIVGFGRETENIGIEMPRGKRAAPIASAEDIDIPAVGGASREEPCAVGHRMVLGPMVGGEVGFPPLVEVGSVEPAAEETTVLTHSAEDSVTGFRAVVVVLERGPRVGGNVVDIDVATKARTRRIDGVDAVADEVGDRADGVGGREIGKALPVARRGGVPPEVAEVTRVVVRPTVEAHADVHVFAHGLRHGVYAGGEGCFAEVAPCVGRGVVAPKAVAAGARAVATAEDVGFSRIRKGGSRGAWRGHVRTARDGHLNVGGAVAGGEGKERQEEYVGLRFNTLLIKGVCRGSVAGRRSIYTGLFLEFEVASEVVFADNGVGCEFLGRTVEEDFPLE